MRYEFFYTRAQLLAIVFVAVVCVASVSKISSARNTTTVQQPEVLRLETRVTQMEQRFYGIEMSLRSLDSRIANMSSRSASSPESAALRSELYVLQQRVVEVECALAKLDERTLAPDLRASRKRSGAINNACRTNVDAPLRLPTDH